MKQSKKFQKVNMLKRKEKILNEKCVLCGVDMGIPITKPISARKNYIQGCGQLCESCYQALHHDSRYFG